MTQPTQTFEEHLAALQDIVDALESGDLPLQASLERYQDGVTRMKSCFELLKGAEAKVKKLVAESGAEVPFDRVDGDEDDSDDDGDGDAEENA
jgi:exodeoxyribonuclease VII small subunit